MSDPTRKPDPPPDVIEYIRHYGGYDKVTVEGGEASQTQSVLRLERLTLRSLVASIGRLTLAKTPLAPPAGFRLQTTYNRAQPVS